MYEVIIKRDGETAEIMETDKMTSRNVYKTALSCIKCMPHMEKSSVYNRYEAYVYKDGEFLYLLGLSDLRYLFKRWIGLTRGSDLKTCVINVLI